MANTVQRCTVGHSAVVDDAQTLVWVVCLRIALNTNFSRSKSKQIVVESDVCRARNECKFRTSSAYNCHCKCQFPVVWHWWLPDSMWQRNQAYDVSTRTMYWWGTVPCIESFQYLCIPRLTHLRGRGRYCWYLKSNPWCTATKPGRLRWSRRR